MSHHLGHVSTRDCGRPLQMTALEPISKRAGDVRGKQSGYGLWRTLLSDRSIARCVITTFHDRPGSNTKSHIGITTVL